jgi:hypothetical protein
MKLSEWIKPSYEVYDKCLDSAREWIEKTYAGLSLEIANEKIEVVRTDTKIDYTPLECERIVDALNLKLDEILETYDDEIVLSERVERIRRNHPRFDPPVADIKELKRDKKFLKYLKELIIKPQYNRSAQ